MIDPGAGKHTIQFLAGNTLAAPAGAADQVSGFDPTMDGLDVSSLLSEANVNLNGDVAGWGHYLSTTNQGGNALVDFDPAGQGGGGTVAVLQGFGSALTGMGQLLGAGAIWIA